MTQADAEQAVVNAGLRTRFTKSASETVPPDHVIRQSPPAGSKVEKNQVVELVISNGKPLLGLDDVRGYNANDAARTLQQAGFAVSLIHRFDNTIKDNVIDQMPKPGAKVQEGSRVTLIVSDGPAPVLVPNFVGMPVDKAQVRAAALGITLDTSQTVAGNPANTVASQSTAAGTKVDKNATVHVVINSGISANASPAAPFGPAAALPNVVGLGYAAAQAALNQAGFQSATRYVVQTTNNGTIVTQDPQAGQSPQGATVTITLSVSGEVPDTEGMSRADAVKTLSDDGYGVSKWEYTTTAGAGGKVVGTTPTAGSALAPGSSVSVTVNGIAPP
jgi:eukaryotic-like serine/threonine-protein kinase